MSRIKWILVPALTLWTAWAWPVSRVGTGTLSNDENGFSAQIPFSYSRAYISSVQNIQLNGRSLWRDGAWEPRLLLVYLLSNESPEWTGRTDRGEFQNSFARKGWTWRPHPEPCIEQWELRSENGFTRVLSWGDGKGVFVASPVRGLEDVIGLTQSLTLEPGACAWK